MGPQQPKSTDGTGASVAVPTAGSFDTAHVAPGQVENYAQVPQHVSPIWPAGTEMEMKIYVAESWLLPPHVSKHLVFDERAITWTDWNLKRSVTVEVPLSPAVQNNGSLYAHIFVGKTGSVLDPTDKKYDPAAAYRVITQLNRYMPKKKVVKTKKLLGGDEEPEVEEEVPDEKGPVIASYWSKNLTMELVADDKIVPYRTLQMPIAQHIMLEQTNARDASGQNGWYYPIVFVNDFWTLKDHLIEINSTVSYVTCHSPGS